jgi:hypothetical protein
MELILPGSPEFSEPLPTPAEVTSRTIFDGDMTGRILALDVTRAKRWQCGGFSVSVNNPLGVVTGQAQQIRLREALIEGLLIDVTDQVPAG